MTSPDADLADELHRLRGIREHAIRQAMAICTRLQPGPGEDSAAYDCGSEAAFRRGHQWARQQLYDELERMLERMLPREAPAHAPATRDDDGGC